jgi:hypothetical protein
MRASRIQAINEFRVQLCDELPLRVHVGAWPTDTRANFWRCEIRLGRDLYWGEFPIKAIASPEGLRVLVRGIANHIPGVHCGA